MEVDGFRLLETRATGIRPTTNSMTLVRRLRDAGASDGPVTEDQDLPGDKNAIEMLAEFWGVEGVAHLDPEARCAHTHYLHACSQALPQLT